MEVCARHGVSGVTAVTAGISMMAMSPHHVNFHVGRASFFSLCPVALLCTLSAWASHKIILQ